VTVARDQPDATALAVRQYPKAVVLDLVNPAGRLVLEQISQICLSYAAAQRRQAPGAHYAEGASLQARP
jgi:hypothetical protein